MGPGRQCASFIVAPRRRTRGLDLRGRSFLHDYDFRQDPELRVLELIMTAPMVVTNWINLQYYASTVDNRRYGSGNKVLHNVVGGRLGVFEGNGGDLRIGLPLQSLHDGRTLRHTPLRLSVFIEAPRSALETVIDRQALVRDIVDNGWLHLFRIDPEQPLVEQRRAGAWVRARRRRPATPGPDRGAVGPSLPPDRPGRRTGARVHRRRDRCPHAGIAQIRTPDTPEVPPGRRWRSSSRLPRPPTSQRPQGGGRDRLIGEPSAAFGFCT